MKIWIEKFRCFGRGQEAYIAPITILVGENSSGKSTFLAAVRFVYDFLQRGAEASFNKEPFYLGGFKSIAHYRGGRYGRDIRFILGISDEVTIPKHTHRNADLFESENAGPINTKFLITFKDNEGEARPHGFRIETDNESVIIEPHDYDLYACIQSRHNDQKMELTAKEAAGILLQKGDFLSLEYAVRELVYSVHVSNEKPTHDVIQAANTLERLWELVRNMGNRLRSTVQALAPVRTQPKRSYDPTQLADTSEGDRLLARIARTSRVNPEQWRRIKKQIDAYGDLSGLFQSVEISKLGRSEMDPFQIIVKASGRKSNIIDVGYGVSQVLPFFVMLAEAQSRETLLIQQPEVHLHPSAQAAIGTVIADLVGKTSKNSSRFIVETHSDFLIDRIRLAVREEQIKPNDLNILFFEKDGFDTSLNEIRVDKYGDPINPPLAYRKFFTQETMKVLGI